MRDSRDHNPAVENQRFTIGSEDLIECCPARGLIPARAEQGATIHERFFHVRVASHDRISEEVDVWRDSNLQQEHEELTEAREPRTGFAQQPPPDLSRRMWQGPLPHPPDPPSVRPPPQVF